MPQTPEQRAERARARREGTRRSFGITIPPVDEAPPLEAEENQPGVFARYAPTLVRAASALVPGTWLGAAAGGGGETLAQYIEKETGQRDDYDPAMIGAESALGAIPFARLGKLLRGGSAVGHVAAGAAAGGAGTLGRQQAAEGLHLPTREDLSEAGKSALVGGAASGILGGLFDRLSGGPRAPKLEIDRYAANTPSDVAATETRVTERIPFRGAEMRRGAKPISTPATDEQAIAERIPGFERFATNTPGAVDDVAGLASRAESAAPDVAPVGGLDVADAAPVPSAAPLTDLRRLLPAFGETSETSNTAARVGYGGQPANLLRPEARTIDLANEYAQENLPGVRVKGLKAYPRPEGKDLLARALRQRAHIDDSTRAARQKFNPESGFASPELLADMGLGTAGALTGAAVDEDNRLRGAGVGLLAGLGLRRAAPRIMSNERGALEIGPRNKHAIDFDEVMRGAGPTMEVVDEVAPRLNASGESAASAEALSRNRGMASRGERFVVRDRAGRIRPLLGPDAVDYRPRPGEQFGIEDGSGFRMLSSEAGMMSPELATDLGAASLGAVAGSATDEDNRGRGAALGALAGFGAGRGIKNPRALERLRFFSMLSSPMTHAKNIAGNVGSLANEAGVKLLSGDVEGAGRLAAAPFRDIRGTVDAFHEGFRNPQAGDANRMGVDWDVDGITSLPGRLIAGVDSASRAVMERGGLSGERAAKAVFGNEPELPLSQWLLRGHRTIAPLRQFVPFAKTPLNIAERGLEHSPLAPILPSVRAGLSQGGQARREAIARMALGTAAGGAAYAAELDDPVAIAAAGPLALPTALGGFTGAADTEKVSTDSAIERGLRQAARMVPGLTPQIPGTQEYFASYVPNAARDMAEVLDPVDEREAPGYFGEAARRMPIVRETLPAKASKGGTRRRRNRNRVTR